MSIPSSDDIQEAFILGSAKTETKADSLELNITKLVQVSSASERVVILHDKGEITTTEYMVLASSIQLYRGLIIAEIKKKWPDSLEVFTIEPPPKTNNN